MTCASCASRIERRLNKLDGVTAMVNYATEKAQVTFPDGVEPAQLVAEAEAAGYTAHLPSTTTENDGAEAGEERDDPTHRSVVALAVLYHRQRRQPPTPPAPHDEPYLAAS